MLPPGRSRLRWLSGGAWPSRCQPQGRQPPLHALDHAVEFGLVLRCQARARRAQLGGGDGAATLQHLLAQREADPRLLLVAHQRQVGIEEVLRRVATTGAVQLVDPAQPPRQGEPERKSLVEGNEWAVL